MHHTNKPPSGREKADWAGNEFAYLGAGSAEWANWARGVIALRGIGSNEIFELRLAKRGARIGWKDSNGERQFARFVGHSKEPGLIYWREADVAEVTQKQGRPEMHTARDLFDILSPEGMTFAEWLAAALAEGWKESTFKRKRKELDTAQMVYRSPGDGKYRPK